MTISGIKSTLSNGDIEGFQIRGRTSQPQLVPQQSSLAATDGGSSTESFVDMLKKGLDQVNETQSQADHAIKEAIAGRNKNVHETMLLIEKADMTYKLAMQVRNKIIDAYREVMKMQI